MIEKEFDLEAVYNQKARQNFKLRQPRMSDITSWINGETLPEHMIDMMQSLWLSDQNFKDNMSYMIQDLSASSFAQRAAASTQDSVIKRTCSDKHFTIMLKPTKKSPDIYWLMIKSVGKHPDITTLSCQSDMQGIYIYKLPHIFASGEDHWQHRIKIDDKIAAYIRDNNAVLHLHSSGI